jgi:hypothetical protein
MRRYITTRGFADDKHSIRILKDEGGDAGAGDVTPTKTNIEAALAWLVSGAQDGDSLFLHYSGHGSKKTDTNHDEEDGFDEVLLPCDFMEVGHTWQAEGSRVLLLVVPGDAGLVASSLCFRVRRVRKVQRGRVRNLQGSDVEAISASIPICCHCALIHS